MTTSSLALISAIGCALCNGTAAVLQKVGADKERNVKSLDASLLIRLAQNGPYLGGVFLDILGWVFTLYAVQYLPLFLVEAVIASNIVVTAVIDSLFLHQRLSKRGYGAIVVIVSGLVILAQATAPDKAADISNLLRWMLVLLPVPIAAIGFLLARKKGQLVNVGLMIVAGLAFGTTSVIGRIFKPSVPLWHTIYSPLILGLIASGILGILLFSIALQRAAVTVTNAVMTARQTLIPAAIGILFLGDEARQGLWYLAVIGTVLTLGGIGYLAFVQSPRASQ
jgi:drug/metabolite transporter (DMT)-like permease